MTIRQCEVNMFSIDSKDFTIASAARITVRDYSDYDSEKCHDGGH